MMEEHEPYSQWNSKELNFALRVIIRPKSLKMFDNKNYVNLIIECIFYYYRFPKIGGYFPYIGGLV